MALLQNTGGKYATAQPDYEAIKLNESFIPQGTTRRGNRGATAANGGDISQLGLERLTSDTRLRLEAAREHRAYFPPEEFDLDMRNDGVLAARVTFNGGANKTWDEDDVENVQKMLKPTNDLTEAEIDAVVVDKLRAIMPELAAYSAVIAAYVNAHAEGNNVLKSVILAVDGDDSLGGGRTIAAGATQEEVNAITGADVMDMNIDSILSISGQIDNSSPPELKAIAALTGAKYFDVTPRLTAVYEPFASAVELARVERVNSIDVDDVEDLINAVGKVAEFKANGQLGAQVRIEVVKATGLRVDLLNEYTDQEFTDEELVALAAGPTQPGANNNNDYASGVAKLRDAKAAADFDWIETANGGNDDEATEAMYDDIGDWEDANVVERDYLAMMAKYAMAAASTRPIKTSEVCPAAVTDFGMVRMTTLNHELYGTSGEVIISGRRVWGALSLGKAMHLIEAVSKGVVGKLQHATAHISFMKSGHHASANNAGHTLVMISEAIGQIVDQTELGERLAAGTYYGSKSADQRAVALYLRYLYATNALSFAIGRRITPQGPGTVSMFLLNMVIDQLHAVSFFKHMDRMEEYSTFKAIYNSYSKTAYLEVPYALYFYGASRPESVGMKQAVAPMYAYAAAIGAAMPNSTIGDSVSLRREATAASSNSITANLEVSAFVKAFRLFLRTFVTAKLKKAAGLNANAGLLEDA